MINFHLKLLKSFSVTKTIVSPFITEIKLSNPTKRNPLSLDTLSKICSGIDALDLNSKILIISSEGPAFSAGHDLKEINQMNDSQRHALFSKLCEIANKLRKIPQVSIASVQGMVTAAGIGLVGACDIVISSPEAKFGLTGINYGLSCVSPAEFLIDYVGDKKLMLLLMEGDFINAENAERIGMVSRITKTHDDLNKETLELAHKIAEKTSESLDIGKKGVYGMKATLCQDKRDQIACESMINLLKAESTQEGVKAFIEKRKPNWNKK